VDFDPAIVTHRRNTVSMPGQFHGEKQLQVVSVANGTHKFVNLPTKNGGMKAGQGPGKPGSSLRAKRFEFQQSIRRAFSIWISSGRSG